MPVKNLHPSFPTMTPTTIFESPWVLFSTLSIIFYFKDQELHGRLASQREYRNNVEHFGEDNFIELLRNTAEKKMWKDLFQHSALCFYLTRCTH